MEKFIKSIYFSHPYMRNFLADHVAKLLEQNPGETSNYQFDNWVELDGYYNRWRADCTSQPFDLSGKNWYIKNEGGTLEAFYKQ